MICCYSIEYFLRNYAKLIATVVYEQGIDRTSFITATSKYFTPFIREIICTRYLF
jgi:hypothetical protein